MARRRFTPSALLASLAAAVALAPTSPARVTRKPVRPAAALVAPPPAPRPGDTPTAAELDGDLGMPFHGALEQRTDPALR